MKEKLLRLIDVKSIVTLMLVAALVALVIYSAVTGKELTGDMFLLFSNCTTMIITYFFTKKQTEGENDGN
ncbi:MAG: hypothetical protein IJP33_05835 [Firmicutes bacterium]|nr:hypothetical protein [Bacillota bacterium]